MAIEDVRATCDKIVQLLVSVETALPLTTNERRENYQKCVREALQASTDLMKAVSDHIRTVSDRANAQLRKNP